MGVEPCSRQIGIFGGQPVDVQDRLQSFDGEFDLPTQPVQRAEQADRNLFAWKRSQKNDVIGAGERAWIDPVLVLLAGSARLGACFGGRCRRHSDQHQALRARIEPTVRLVPLNWDVERALRARVVEQVHPVDRLTARMGQLQALP